MNSRQRPVRSADISTTEVRSGAPVHRIRDTATAVRKRAVDGSPVRLSIGHTPRERAWTRVRPSGRTRVPPVRVRRSPCAGHRHLAAAATAAPSCPCRPASPGPPLPAALPAAPEA
ncbi:hypothetical protein GCM10012285_32540 [Streptomyces kronopolitis]|uniref:Uncharacterized protein n=1 Tax=Streptomyces kronopolitis TaxID=1612435 RepID=A0ABQ2JLE5_9ACTN|nr:hypothetical protein GCM10012285_32540 [Streptomyces kronopolitis]